MNANYAKAKQFFQNVVVTKEDGHDFLPLGDLHSYGALEDVAGYDAEVDFGEVLEFLEISLPEADGWKNLTEAEQGIVLQMAVDYCTSVDGLFVNE